MAFADKLKTLRLENNMTQEYVAARMNVARSTIAGYETKNRQPSHEKLTAFASLFHVTVDYLLDDDNAPVCVTLANSNSPSADAQQLLTIYHNLSSHSKKDLIKFAHLLELGDKEQAHR